MDCLMCPSRIFKLGFVVSLVLKKSMIISTYVEESTPQPLSIEVATIKPFPIPLVTGTGLDVNVLFQLKEVCPVGTTVKMDMKLTGLIEVPIPCLEIDDIALGSW